MIIILQIEITVVWFVVSQPDHTIPDSNATLFYFYSQKFCNLLVHINMEVNNKYLRDMWGDRVLMIRLEAIPE